MDDATTCADGPATYAEGYDDPTSPNYVWPDQRADDRSRWWAEHGHPEALAYDADHPIGNEAEAWGIAAGEHFESGEYVTGVGLAVGAAAMGLVAFVAEPWNQPSDYREDGSGWD